uniref:Uncharacterized protein n=1 Tax=Trichogramma kaykai TaxID=54128 RepID=A0ABD2W7S2_9HYME
MMTIVLHGRAEKASKVINSRLTSLSYHNKNKHRIFHTSEQQNRERRGVVVSSSPVVPSRAAARDRSLRAQPRGSARPRAQPPRPGRAHGELRARGDRAESAAGRRGPPRLRTPGGPRAGAPDDARARARVARSRGRAARTALRQDPGDRRPVRTVARTTIVWDKIKCVDERLKKGRDELSNLEKSNRELEQQIQQTELELERQASIGTITSADRAGIARMRRLAEEAVRTKRNIRALEARQALVLGRVEAVLRSGNARCYRLCENNVAAAASRPKHHVYRPKLKKKRCIQKNRSREFWPNASCHSCCHGVKDHHHHRRLVEYVESKSAQHVNSKEGCEGYGGHDLRNSSRHTCGEGKQKERTTCRVKEEEEEEEDVEEEEEEKEENC